MSDTVDFSGLSPKQLEVFEQIAINNDAGHNQRTLDSLVKKGLIEQYQDDFIDHIGHTYINRYRIPISIHAQRCAWCADQDLGGTIDD